MAKATKNSVASKKLVTRKPVQAKRWSVKEINVMVKLREQGKSFKVIAARLGRSEGSVWSKA